MSIHVVEPGVLQIFRRFMLIVWVFLTLAFCGAFDESIPDFFAIVSWVHTSFLLIYLYRSWFNRRFGVWYLPIALIYVSVMPIYSLYFATFLNLANGVPAELALLDPGNLYLWLVLPLLIISTQYNMRTMLLFTFGTAFLSMTLAIPLAFMGGPAVKLTWEPTFVRIVLFGIVGYVVVRITEAQREQRKTLAQKNVELAHYASTLEQLAITRERNRMARELHDTLAHTLSAVNIQLKALEVLMETDPVSAKETLLQTQQLTRDGLHESRRALHALRSNNVKELGCVLAIQQTATAKAERAGLKLHLDLPVQIVNVSPLVEQNLFRIVDEAITNIIRHANATAMSIALYQKPESLELCIQDNGVGFDMRNLSQNGHYGITGMKERALLVNGDLNIESQVGQGTTVKLRLENSL